MKIEQILRFSVLHSIVRPMLHDHFKEVGNPVYEFVNPDVEKYEAIEAEGRLLMLVAFVPFGWQKAAVGYSVNIITDHIHYEHARVCCNDVLYVMPEYRDTTAGARLMLATKGHAAELGCKLMQWHAKPDTALNTALSKRTPVFEHVYQERL